MLVSVGLVPSTHRLAPASFELVACLPHLLDRLHGRLSSAASADLSRRLTWQSVYMVLEALDASKVDAT
ncbi:hypothetical protein ACI3PL_31530, partial [Lacticaseibacillus paracasei]